MKKYNRILIILMIIIFTTSVSYGELVEENKETKTILIIVDELGFDGVNKIIENYYGLGFLNIKGKKPAREESLYMSINTGRKVSMDNTKFEGIIKSESGLKIKNYEEIYKDFIERNDNLKLKFLTDNIRTSFIGNDSVALLASNSKGDIISGENKIEYEKEWLNEKTDENLGKTDLLIMSYKIENQDSRQKLLKDFINNNRNSNIFVIPRKTSKSLGSFLNKNLTPMIYLKNGETGILKSDSTRRKGFVTVEDINYEILNSYDMEGNNIGNKINIIPEEKPLSEGRNIYNEIFNLLIIAIIFQTIIYLNQGYTSYEILRFDNVRDMRLFNNFILTNIVVSFILSLFNLHRYLLVYLGVNLALTYFITERVDEKKDSIGIISVIIYIILIISILLKPDILYNSYLGFNNLFYGARYYGFNNGIMGVFIVTSILTYFYFKDKFKNENLLNIFTLAIFSLNMVILSAGNAANTGGFITSVGLFLTIVYLKLLDKKSSFKKIIALILIGILIFGLNMYFDNKSQMNSHAISFLLRIKESGVSEVINMVKSKLTELIKYTLLPPFNILMIGQIFTIRKLTKYMDRKLKRVSGIIFFISILAYFINDTGMIAFVFMNQFNIANILSKINQMDIEV